ncbi:MAG TPA: helix-turn-helix domain-containing protein, partial [Candidatus Elarobacter sp.]|nr:helix-turn-helix domain-containing protein [Candidatus Elarobacter sp.]
LARWLLLAGFRASRTEFPITHESLGAILGTRRASISEAIVTLEAREAISSKRTVVLIRNAERLREIACECYAVCRDAIEESRLREPFQLHVARTATGETGRGTEA